MGEVPPCIAPEVLRYLLGFQPPEQVASFEELGLGVGEETGEGDGVAAVLRATLIDGLLLYHLHVVTERAAPPRLQGGADEALLCLIGTEADRVLGLFCQTI